MRKFIDSEGDGQSHFGNNTSPDNTNDDDGRDEGRSFRSDTDDSTGDGGTGHYVGDTATSSNGMRSQNGGSEAGSCIITVTSSRTDSRAISEASRPLLKNIASRWSDDTNTATLAMFTLKRPDTTDWSSLDQAACDSGIHVRHRKPHTLFKGLRDAGYSTKTSRSRANAETFNFKQK